MSKKEGEAGSAAIDSWVARALGALEEVKEVVVRSSQAGKIRIDTAFLEKEKDNAMRRLGEQIYEWLEDDRVELPKEAEPLVEAVRSLQQQIEAQKEELASVRDPG